MKRIILLIITVVGMSNVVIAQHFYVSTNVSDSNPGTKELPFQTLQAALNKSKGTTSTIFLREGIYLPDQTVQLDTGNSGITIKAYNREEVIFSAGLPLTNWKQVRHPSPGNKRPSKVWKAILPEKLPVLALYNKNGLLPRCSSDKFKAIPKEVIASEGANLDAKNQSKKTATPSKLYYQPDQIDHVKSFEDAEVFILPRYDWVSNYLPIKSVDTKQRLIETSCPGTYELSTPQTWTQIELYYQIENVPEFLDDQNEWYFNKKENAIYMISEEKPEGIIVPRLNQLISIEGNLENGNLVKDVSIEGITFKHARRMTWEHGRVGVQHDWEIVDGDWACIKAKGVSGLNISNCLFEKSAGNGIRLDLEGWNNHISNNEFRNLGGSAISIIGYGVGTRDRLHSNSISSNHIHHCAELWWLQAGITVCQSSYNKVVNNLIHNMPYNGMAFVSGRAAFFGKGPGNHSPANGLAYVNWDDIPEEVDEWYEKIGYLNTRDNRIENNEIFAVVEKLGDGNAIYLSGVGTGNILEKNFIHDMPSLSSAGGLRFDNDTWYCVMRNNVVWNVNSCSIVSKWVNTIENNIMVNSGVRPNLNLGAGPKWGSNIRRNIVVNKRSLFEATMNKWMKIENIFAKGELHECIITDNLFFISDDHDLGKSVTKSLNENCNALNNLNANPDFYDLENGDFRLTKNSPALKLGFIPFTDYGLKAPVGRINQ